MSNILKLAIFVSLLLFVYSCEKETMTIDDTIIETETRAKGCFEINFIEELEDGCCRYEICRNSTPFDEKFIQVNNDAVFQFSSETGCMELTLCGMNTVTLLDKPVQGQPNTGCTKTITCHDSEACCESICFDFVQYNIIEPFCIDFFFTLDGDPTCYPNGIYMSTSYLMGPIELIDYSSDEGTVELQASNPDIWRFRFCMDDLYAEKTVEIKIRELYCNTVKTFKFDPFRDELYHGRCK